jgi:hypothetical protein
MTQAIKDEALPYTSPPSIVATAISHSDNSGLISLCPREHWMKNVVRPIDSFELEIGNKISPYPHYPGPIHNIGGLHLGSHCRIPGVQPLTQTILHHYTSPQARSSLTQYCFDYGNTRFPPKCNCDEKYDCNCQGRRCGTRTGNCSSTCGSCNHNSNVIFY